MSHQDMAAHITMQTEAMTTYGKFIECLDDIVDVNTLRTVLHDSHTLAQAIAKNKQTGYAGYYRRAASFLAQRACETAQANALLLRHGYQDQALELWRTMRNIQQNLEALSGINQEETSKQYWDTAATELIHIDRKARASDTLAGRIFNESQDNNLQQLLQTMEVAYGKQFLRMDGWKPSVKDLGSNQQRPHFDLELNQIYQLASKSQHGSPMSALFKADVKMHPLRNPLEHDIHGIPIQSLITSYTLHEIISTFCSTTEESTHPGEPELMKLSKQHLKAQIDGYKI